MPKIAANGLTFHVQQAGAGPDVVLIHGITGDLSIWFLCKAMTVLARSGSGSRRSTSGGTATPTSRRPATPRATTQPTCLRSWTTSGSGRRKSSAIQLRRGDRAARGGSRRPNGSKRWCLSDPYFPGLRHLEDLSRWNHWQVVPPGGSRRRDRTRRASTGMISGKFFDQVMHLDEERPAHAPQVGRPPDDRVGSSASATRPAATIRRPRRD